jgi:hypothetical protein
VIKSNVRWWHEAAAKAGLEPEELAAQHYFNWTAPGRFEKE